MSHLAIIKQVKLKALLKNHYLVIIIIVLAAILRFWRLEALTTFSGDQGYDFLIVKRMLVDGKFTLLGPKIGPYNELGNLYLGPAYYYLIAPFLLIFNFDPIGPAVLTVILALGTILLIYLIGLTFFSKPAAILASSLYAFNVFLIDQSRAASNPHLIPFFVALLIFSILQITVKESQFRIWSIVAGISMGIMFQLHYLTVSLIPVVLIMFVISHHLGKILPMILSFLIAILPQIIFEFRHQFFITNQFLKQFAKGSNVSPVDKFSDHFLQSTQSLSVVFISIDKFLYGVTILLILVLFVIKAKRTQKPIILLILTIVFGLIFASAYSGPIRFHYFASTYASMVILIATGFIFLLNLFKNLVLKIILILALAQIFASNFLNLNLTRKEGYTMPQGWNLIGVKNASTIIAHDVNQTQKFNIAAALDGDTRARPYRYLVEVMGKIPQNVEEYPSSDVLYLISRDEEETIYGYTVWEVASFAPFKITQRWHIQNGISLYKLVKNLKTS